jgi:chloride channel protein, CIC family
MAFVPDVHLAGLRADAGATRLGKLARSPEAFLLPEMNIRLAAHYFEQTEIEALAVVDNENERHVIGLLTEAHVLRRYADDLGKANRELSGDWSDAS